ncbi:hypothetical protein C7475_11020 [Chitinophaga sp. S165]|nr:hypothetical protein C7475_11020 [Chitinophaga sp. S165]
MANYRKVTCTADSSSIAEYYMLNWGNIVNNYTKSAWQAGSKGIYDAKRESDFWDYIYGQ